MIAPGAARPGRGPRTVSSLRPGQQGWGNVGKEADQGFSWTQPLFGDFWMAWTPATIAFFVFVFACIALMGFLEWRSPGGNPRHGVLGLDTTRGDRLFITLLGTAWIVLGWLVLFLHPDLGRPRPRRRVGRLRVLEGLKFGMRNGDCECLAPQTFRSTISFLISAIAFAGFRCFGQVWAQFMMVWQR